MTNRRVIRQRIWSGDKAQASQVGENLRDIQAFVKDAPVLRVINIENATYVASSGFDVSYSAVPAGLIVILVRGADGSQPAGVLSLPAWTYNNGIINFNATGLVNGTRYALIRLLVIN